MSIYCFFVWLFFSPQALAQDTVVEIDKIVISESREVADKTKASTTIPLKSTAPRSDSVADVISRVSGVSIRKFGGLESSTSVSIRGSSSQQVDVFLDGVPLQTASGEGVGLGQMSTNSLAQIDIFKVFSPAEYGAGSVGGVIDLKSRPLAKGVSQHYGASFGSFLTTEANAYFSHGGEKNSVQFGLDYRRTKGNFTFTDNNGTPLNSGDDTRATRQNNEAQNIHPFFKWRHQFDLKTTLTLASHVFRIDQGIPGLENFQSQFADLSTTEVLGSLRLKRKRLFGGKVKIDNNLFWRHIQSQFTDLSAEIGLGQAQDNDNRTFLLGDRFLWQTRVSEIFNVKKGVEFIHEYFLPKDYVAANPVGSSSTRKQLNLTLEPQLILLKKRLTVSAQAQSLNAFYDINDNDPSLATPGLFASARTENEFAGSFFTATTLTKNLTVKAAVGRAVRLPKFIEMFGDQGTVLGNPQLTSEKTVKYDVGLNFVKGFERTVLKKLTLSSSWFQSWTSDLIQFELASGFSRAANIGRARIFGAELVASANFKKFFTTSANYTFTWAKDRAINPGNFLIGVPLHAVNAQVVFAHKNMSITADANFIDHAYLDALNTQALNDRLVLNLGAGYFIKERYRVGLEAKNLTNVQVVDAVGFPLPGRAFYGRFDVYFE